MTETAFFHFAGQKDMFKDIDVEECKIVATLDTLTDEYNNTGVSYTVGKTFL